MKYTFGRNANGKLVVTFTTNLKDLELLYAVVNKADTNFLRLPETTIIASRLHNLNVDLCKALKQVQEQKFQDVPQATVSTEKLLQKSD